MYYYVEAFCSPYRQLMPVKYDKKDDGEFHKVGMACDHVAMCGVSLEDCKHFQIAPEIVPEDKLYQKKIGEAVR